MFDPLFFYYPFC